MEGSRLKVVSISLNLCLLTFSFFPTCRAFLFLLFLRKSIVPEISSKTLSAAPEMWATYRSCARAVFRVHATFRDSVVCGFLNAIGVEAIATRLEAIATRLEAIVTRVEAIATRVEAIATRVEAIATRVEAIAIRLEAIATRVEAIATRVEAITTRLEAIATRLEAIATRLEAIATRLEAIATRGHRY